MMPGVGLERRRHERLARDEGDDELGGGVEPGPVGLAREGVDVAAQHLDVLLDERLALGALLAGGGDGDLAGLEVGAERHLGIHGDVLAAGQVDDHVGAASTGIRADARLHVEVDALDEARGLHDVAQLGLAPDAAGRVAAQGRGERLGRGAQTLLRLGRGAQLLGQLPVLDAALVLELRHLVLHRAQRLLHGSEGLQHLRLALFPLGGGLASVRWRSINARYCLLRVDELGLQGVEAREGRRRAAPAPRRASRPPARVPRRRPPRTGLQHGGVDADRPRARDEHADDATEDDAGTEAEKQGEDGVHAPSVAPGADIARVPSPG
jgi:hypothetical protein